ncbi:MAG: oligoendopeptidase F [Bacilli bacterium]|nr:oligoendopeptidase F [Bacilli bacterium]
MSTIKTREEINDEYKWDLTKIFKNLDEFNTFYEETKKLIERFKKYENHVMDSSKTLLSVIKDDIEISRRIEKLYSYTHMLCDEDISNNENQELNSKILNLYDLAIKNSYFLTPEILKVEKEIIDKYLKEEKELEEFKRYIEKIYRYKKYTLSDDEEKILSKLSKAFDNDETTYSYLTDSDMTLGNIKDENDNDVELNDTNYSIYIKSKDRRVRIEAFKALYAGYKQYKNTISSCLNGHIKENVALTKLRGYESVFEKELYKDELNIDIYNTLVNTIHNNLDVYQKYFNLKKDILGLDEMHMYDVYTDLIKDYDKKYTFEEAKDLVFKATSILGKKYTKDLEKAFTEKWIDIYPNKNKRGGAYSGGCFDTYPYLLLNYQERLDDVSTLIHELGHSMHSFYTRNNNPYQYGDYPIFVAEVASTTNELLLAYYLINNSNDDNEKMAALNHLMELFKSTIYRQVMFEEFEKYAYDLVENDDVITSDKLSDKYLELNKLYFGDSVVVDDEIKYEWERIPHFYYNFYVYKYATSLCAACDIVTRILNNEENSVSNYLKMLESGNFYNPIDTLKIAGVDMTNKKVYENAIKMFDKTIEEFKVLTKKNERKM